MIGRTKNESENMKRIFRSHSILFEHEMSDLTPDNFEIWVVMDLQYNGEYKTFFKPIVWIPLNYLK